MSKTKEFEPEDSSSVGDDEDAATLAAIDEGICDVKTGHTAGFEEVRKMLENRWNDLKSGRVAPVDGQEALDRLRLKSENRRRS